MKFFKYISTGIFVTIIAFSILSCRSISAPVSREPEESTSDQLHLDSKEPSQDRDRELISMDESELLPIDPAVVVGKLDNGLTYYIRENKKPENIGALELVVDIGSAVEEENERGLAHFVEHMAFNGTAHFEKTEIIDYFESIGIRFGPEVNASTSFDETVYQLEVPTDNREAVLKAFQILADWTHLVTFKEEDVEKERGIIVEEWRQRSGARMRIVEKHYPVLFKGSRYAERMPIGTLEVLKNTSAEQLQKFYEKWYRPDLMAVIAVGDFNVEEIEKIIKDAFSPVPEHKETVERPFFPVPDHDETLFSIVTDPETTESRFTIYLKQDVQVMKTRKDYRKSIVEYLCAGMLNNRLDELTKMSDPPFITAGAGGGRIIKTKEAIIYNATVPEGGITRGIEALLLEARRAAEMGFTSTELEREKQNILRWIEQAYLERNSTPSRSYVGEYRRNFLEEETIPGIENEYELFSTYVPAITLDEINSLAKDWSGEKNRVVLISAPDKSNDRIPDEEEVRLVFERVKSMQITPYEDKTREEPLMAELPTPGTILHEHSLENIQTIRWILSNGAEVYLKPTDFKSDEVLFEAISPGGHSLVSDEEYIAAITAPTAVKDSGLGNFSRTELEKKLAGQVVSLTPWISEIHEGLEGSASTRDIETLFKLIYLSFTKPRKDPDAFQSYQERLRTRFENRLSNPEEVFWDTVRTTLQQNHYRSRPFTTEILEEMDLDLSFKIFKERFSNASDFTFVFVGSFDIETIKPFVLSYIGGLPSSGTRESWRDLEIDPPSVSVQKRVSMGIDPRSQVQIIFSDSLPWSYEKDFFLEAMAEILDMRLRETVREEVSGTYGIWVWATTQKFPDNEYTVYIGFGCDPERVEDLTAIVFEQIEWIRSGKIDDIYLTKEREILKLNLEKSQRENKYWLNNMATQLRRGEDLGILLKRKELIDQLTSEIIQQTARLTLNTDHYIRVVLYPASVE